MRILLITSILGYVFGALFDGPKCTYQTATFDLSDSNGQIIDYNGIFWNSGLGCWSNDFSCGSSRFEGSFVKTFIRLGVEETYTYSTEAKRCIADNACNKLAGGENKCQYAEYTYQKWRPQSCDESQDFDAITEDHDVKFYFACCNNPNYCNANIDYTSADCVKSDPFTAYMQALNTCWNDFKVDFMKELLCDDEHGDILTYSDECTNNDGSFRRDRRLRAANAVAGVNCTYRATCAPQLRTILTDYGSCACASASTNGYTGEFIGTAMEVNWNRWCPGIEVECAKDGVLKLLYKYWRARYRFRIAVAKAVITEEIKQQIREKIAERLNVSPDRIVISEDDTTAGTTRRRLAETSQFYVDIKSDDKNQNTYLQSQLTLSKDAIANDIAAAVGGATVDNTAVSSDEAEEENTSTYTGDATKNADGATGDGATGEGNEANMYMMYGVIGAVIFALVN